MVEFGRTLVCINRINNVRNGIFLLHINGGMQKIDYIQQLGTKQNAIKYE